MRGSVGEPEGTLALDVLSPAAEPSAVYRAGRVTKKQRDARAGEAVRENPDSQNCPRKRDDAALTFKFGRDDYPGSLAAHPGRG